MKGKAIASALMGAVLVFSLVPAAAFAAPVKATGAALQQSGNVAVQAKGAKKATVYIATRLKIAVDDGYSVNTRTFTFNYNANKLVSRRTEKSKNGGGTSWDATAYSYRGTNLASKVYETSYMGNLTTAYTTSGKGLVKRTVEVTPGYFEGKDMVNTYDVSYRNGKPVMVVHTNDDWVFNPSPYSVDSSNPNDYVPQRKVVTQRLYYNKKGLVRAVKEGSDDGAASTSRFSYDKKGNVKKVVRSNATYACANKYDANGNLAKRVVTSKTESAKRTCTFKWKKVKVSKALAKKVAKQQWSIVNGDMNVAFCEHVDGIGSGMY